MAGETLVERPPYGERVAALAGGAVEERLDAWAAAHGEPTGRWRRVFGRLEPGRSPWAVLAYESAGGCTVRVLVREPEGGEPAGALGPVEVDRLRAARDALARAHDRLPARPLVPVHGAPHMHQWLVDGAGRLGLVDFDRYALGEPELDLATFLVELESESPRAVGMAELEAATVAGFRAGGGRVDADRMALWTAHKRLAKVARTAAALRPDAGARALAHLDRLDLTALDG